MDAPKQKPLRLSIQPTYDSRQTGPRFEVETFVADRFVSRTPLQDPFVRHTVKVSICDTLRSLCRFGCVKVEININGDDSIIEDIFELDANHIGFGNTRRVEWNASLETALREVADAPSVPSGNAVITHPLSKNSASVSVERDKKDLGEPGGV